MTTSKRRTAQQIAADAHLAYRASVAAKHTQAGARSDHHARKAATLRLTATTHEAIAKRFATQADALACELSRLDAAAALLTADDATADTLMAAANALPVEV